MAANKATVSISASVLPDDMKVNVGGTIEYDLNDMAGDDSKWIYYVNDTAPCALSAIFYSPLSLCWGRFSTTAS